MKLASTTRPTGVGGGGAFGGAALMRVSERFGGEELKPGAVESAAHVASGVPPDVEGGVPPPGENAAQGWGALEFKTMQSQVAFLPPGGTPAATD